MTHWVFVQISIGSCSTQPARGKICLCSRWATETIAAGRVEDDRPRRGGALIERQNVIGHVNLP